MQNFNCASCRIVFKKACAYGPACAIVGPVVEKVVILFVYFKYFVSLRHIIHNLFKSLTYG